MIRLSILIALLFSTLPLGKVNGKVLNSQEKSEIVKSTVEVSQACQDFYFGGRESSNFSNFSSQQKLSESGPFLYVSKALEFFLKNSFLERYIAPRTISPLIDLIIFIRVLRI